MADRVVYVAGHLRTESGQRVEAEGGGGTVESVAGGDGVTVDDTDPANPIVTAEVTQAGADARYAQSPDARHISVLSQEDYDLLTPDPDTLYFTDGGVGPSDAADFAADPAFTDAYVQAADIRQMVVLTQAAYNLLTPDAETFYVIVP